MKRKLSQEDFGISWRRELSMLKREDDLRKNISRYIGNLGSAIQKSVILLSEDKDELETLLSHISEKLRNK